MELSYIFWHSGLTSIEKAIIPVEAKSTTSNIPR